MPERPVLVRGRHHRLQVPRQGQDAERDGRAGREGGRRRQGQGDGHPKGANLEVPTLPLRMVVQLRASNGLCFESGFSSTGMQRNDAGQFKGKSD